MPVGGSRTLRCAVILALLASCAHRGGREARENDVGPPPDLSRFSSPAELGRVLTGDLRGDREKAWAIYRWIARNIVYDLHAAQEGSEVSPDPEFVLQRRSAVCAGFSDLFVSLAQAAGLEAVGVDGYAKGLGYEAGDTFAGQPTNHAWNAVRIDGQWELVDCTWGSGAVDGEGNFHQRFEAYYFLTPPREFLCTHFPLDLQWQLVKEPVTLAEFERLPYVKPAFYRCGLQLKSEAGCVIETERRSLTVEIGVPEDTDLLAKLGKASAAPKRPQVIPGSRHRGVESYRITLPDAGAYTLRIFAGRGPGTKEGRRELEWALDFKIVAR